MSRISILKRAFKTARAGLVFVRMFSPVHAAYQHDAVNVFPDLPKSASAVDSSTMLTAQLPWPAPVGHRQPRQVDVPQRDSVSAWERQQQQTGRQGAGPQTDHLPRLLTHWPD